MRRPEDNGRSFAGYADLPLGLLNLRWVNLLDETPAISKHLTREELAKLCDPANYLGQSGVMVDRVLSRVRTGGLGDQAGHPGQGQTPAAQAPDLVADLGGAAHLLGFQAVAQPCHLVLIAPECGLVVVQRLIAAGGRIGGVETSTGATKGRGGLGPFPHQFGGFLDEGHAGFGHTDGYACESGRGFGLSPLCRLLYRLLCSPVLPAS